VARDTESRDSAVYNGSNSEYRDTDKVWKRSKKTVAIGMLVEKMNNRSVSIRSALLTELLVVLVVAIKIRVRTDVKSYCTNMT